MNRYIELPKELVDVMIPAAWVFLFLPLVGQRDENLADHILWHARVKGCEDESEYCHRKVEILLQRRVVERAEAIGVSEKEMYEDCRTGLIIPC